LKERPYFQVALFFTKNDLVVESDCSFNCTFGGYMAKKRPGLIVFGSDHNKPKSKPVPAPASTGVARTALPDTSGKVSIVAQDSSADTQSFVGTDGDLTWARPPDYHKWPEARQELADAVARRNAELDRSYPPPKR
jgi:hypothetical protein